jgi:hypothetical protein
MPVARFVLFALALSSLPAFAQLRQPADAGPSTSAGLELSWTDLDASDLSGNIVTPQETTSAQSPTALGDEQSKTERMAEATSRLMDDMHIDPSTQTLTVKFSPDGQIKSWVLENKVCYSIRSYLVARDHANSDSTHPVSSTTCRPSRHYSVRTVQGDADSPGR